MVLLLIERKASEQFYVAFSGVRLIQNPEEESKQSKNGADVKPDFEAAKQNMSPYTCSNLSVNNSKIRCSPRLRLAIINL